MQTVCLTDITGTIGQWLDSKFEEEVPEEVIVLLQKAYKIAVSHLD